MITYFKRAVVCLCACVCSIWGTSLIRQYPSPNGSDCLRTTGLCVLQQLPKLKRAVWICWVNGFGVMVIQHVYLLSLQCCVISYEKNKNSITWLSEMMRLRISLDRKDTKRSVKWRYVNTYTYCTYIHAYIYTINHKRILTYSHIHTYKHTYIHTRM